MIVYDTNMEMSKDVLLIIPQKLNYVVKSKTIWLFKILIMSYRNIMFFLVYLFYFTINR